VEDELFHDYLNKKLVKDINNSLHLENDVTVENVKEKGGGKVGVLEKKEFFFFEEIQTCIKIEKEPNSLDTS